jgi:LysM repeat protein
MLVAVKYKLGILVVIWISVTTILGACYPEGAISTPTSTHIAQITPYWSPSPSQTVTPKISLIKTSTPRPPPTSTPVTYRVIKGDTMLGIALRYGIRLEYLLSANPEVDPRFLSVDTVLVIPQREESSQSLVTPTPPTVDRDDPICYSTADQGLWCFLLIVNSQEVSLENPSTWIGLYNEDGAEQTRALATAPLNILLPGEATPLMVYFPSPVAENFTVGSDQFNAFVVPEGTDRYLTAKKSIHQVEISPEGLSAVVKGEVGLPKKSKPAQLIWLLAVAYGPNGEVVGTRRYDLPGLETQTEASARLGGGESLPFTVEIFSLGPPIDHVDVLVEMRP